MRGTITSWMRRSPSSMTAWIICSSSASSTPDSPPRSTSSLNSSALIRSAASARMPSGRVTAPVTVVRRSTTGPKRRASQSIGPEMASAIASGRASEIVLGTSSPKTIVKRLRIAVTMTSASGSANGASGSGLTNVIAPPMTTSG